MKYNPLINELSRGQWFMSFEGLNFWGPIAHKIISGDKVDLENHGKEAKALVSFINESGKSIAPDATGNVPPGTIAVVDLIGAIIKYGDWCTYGADEIVSILTANDKNPNIVAQILNIDGPGGAVSAVAPFVEFGKAKTKPVVGLLDMCCSAHYYIAVSCCDHLMAANNISSTIGSIGVVFSFVDNRPYLEKLGYKFHDIYAPESEHKNEPFILALKGEYDKIKTEMLSPIAQKFQNDVRAARPNLKEEVGVLTGKTFGADLALKYGMIDSIGSFSQALFMAQSMSEMSHYT